MFWYFLQIKTLCDTYHEVGVSCGCDILNISPCSQDFPPGCSNALRYDLMHVLTGLLTASYFKITFDIVLRRQNTRYKNPQLDAQHCFVASFRRCFPFSPCVIKLSRNKNFCCGLKKVVAKSRARVYFEQQILALLPVFHQTHNLSRNEFARALANQPISAPQQMFCCGSS